MESRLTTVADAPALAHLHGESFGAVRWDAAQIAQSLALPTVRGWIVSRDEEPAGFILVQIAGGEAEILTFCVALPVRRRGIGAALLETALLDACEQGATRMFLEVAADNPAAAALYEKHGFTLNGRRKDYYRNAGAPVDAVMYARNI